MHWLTYLLCPPLHLQSQTRTFLLTVRSNIPSPAYSQQQPSDFGLPFVEKQACDQMHTNTATLTTESQTSIIAWVVLVQTSPERLWGDLINQPTNQPTNLRSPTNRSYHVRKVPISLSWVPLFPDGCLPA